MSSGSESAQTTSTPNAPARRRSSGIMPKFESLQQQKRANNDTRRQSMNDPHVKPGFFGQIFQDTFGRTSK